MRGFRLFSTLILVGCSACALPAETQSGVSTQNNQQNDAPPTTLPAEMPSETNADNPTSLQIPAQESAVAEKETDAAMTGQLTYPIVDSEQFTCYDHTAVQPCPAPGEAFYGQDAQYAGLAPAYQDNGDGTISDLNTGLMWQKNPGSKMTYPQAVSGAQNFDLAGYHDWRLPTIKELYSLILFDGTDVSYCPGGSCQVIPFIQDRYFDFSYGDVNAGERAIDSQFASATQYVSTTMNGQETDFGVNFADGRIKGYGLGQNKTFYVLYVRGNPEYGRNQFSDNGDGSISDAATALTWMQADSGFAMDWQAALEFCENNQSAGYDDWRLPDAKELQSIVDYTRSPATSASAAIDPLFSVSRISNEAGGSDYPYFWSSTTHADSAGHGSSAVYLAFGTAPGYMQNRWIDVHGAGAQRSDPKTGSAADYPNGHGPQGDAIRIMNYVRCVRGGNVVVQPQGVNPSDRPARIVEAGDLQQQNNGGQGAGLGVGRQAGRQPPQQAIDACSDFRQGDACQFNTPNGLISGTCTLLDQLTCVPPQAQ